MKKALVIFVMVFLSLQKLFASETELTQEGMKKYSRLNATVWGQSYYYNVQGRDLVGVINEMNIDMFTHIFINPLVKHRNIKIYADLERNDLTLYVQVINGDKHKICSFREISSPSDLLQKVSEYVENKWAMYKLFSFPSEFEIPQWNSFDHLESISITEVEIMSKHYVEELVKVMPNAAKLYDSKLVTSFYIH